MAGVRFLEGERALLLSTPQRPDRLWGPNNLLSNGYGGSLPGVKQPGCEAAQSYPSSTEVKKGGAIPTLLIRHQGVVLNCLMN
jgi:hypothetical protein